MDFRVVPLLGAVAHSHYVMNREVRNPQPAGCFAPSRCCAKNGGESGRSFLIFPDVIEWDELRTGRRQEGIYYGIKNFIRKFSGAVAMFIALQALERFGYQTPPEGVTFFTQPDSAVLAIRILIGPLGAVLLFSAVLIAWFYPLTREKRARIRKLLARRKERAE